MAQSPHIAFIGAGNMSGAIINGLLGSGVKPQSLRASTASSESLTPWRDKGLSVSTDNNAIIEGADIVVLGVKPQGLRAVCEQIAPSIRQSKPLVISVAAGIGLGSLQQWLGEGLAIVRSMPNTPSRLGCGATGLVANDRVSDRQREQTEQLLNAVGICCWVDSEAELDAVIAVSGSGPAYFFLFVEAMIAAGEKLGLSRDVATRLANQTALGAARMLSETGEDAATLRRQVTSPGGTTAEAIETFLNNELPATVEQAMRAAVTRAQAMSRELG